MAAVSDLSEQKTNLPNVEGRPIPYLKNWLREQRSLGDRVEDAKTVTELLEHPGWAIVEELAAVVAEHGEQRLQKIAGEVALSGDIQARIDFARKRGVQDNVSFYPDVVASIVESAKTAAQELREAAEMAAEGTN